MKLKRFAVYMTFDIKYTLSQNIHQLPMPIISVLKCAKTV